MFTKRHWPGGCLKTLLALGLGLAFATLVSPARGGKPKPPPQPLVYTMTQIPMEVSRMNNVGDVAGSGLYLASTDEAYDLNVLFEDQLPAGGAIVSAADINDPDPVFATRQIAGAFLTADAWVRAFRGAIGLDADGAPIALSFTVLPEVADFHSYATAINDLGDIVGWLEGAHNDPNGRTPLYAVLWPAEGGLVQLCTTYSSASDINDAGQVSGWMRTAADERHAFRYSPGAPPVLLDLGGLPKRPTSQGNGINAQGQVVGEAKGPYYYDHVIRYTDGVGLEDLGTFFTERFSASGGKAINAGSQVVGRALDWRSSLFAGFLYTDASGYLDLAKLISNPPPGLNGTSIEPLDINDVAGRTYGQILVNTNLGAFVLTPNK